MDQRRQAILLVSWTHDTEPNVKYSVSLALLVSAADATTSRSRAICWNARRMGPKATPGNPRSTRNATSGLATAPAAPAQTSLSGRMPLHERARAVPEWYGCRQRLGTCVDITLRTRAACHQARRSGPSAAHVLSRPPRASRLSPHPVVVDVGDRRDRRSRRAQIVSK